MVIHGDEMFTLDVTCLLILTGYSLSLPDVLHR